MTSKIEQIATIKLLASGTATVVLLMGLSISIGVIPPIGTLLSPNEGIWVITVEDNPQFLHAPLKGPVKVFVDEHGIPTIEAKFDTDLYFVTGYMQARDRLFQMYLQKYLVEGRLAEIFGPSLIESDILMRQLDLVGSSQKTFNYLVTRARQDPNGNEAKILAEVTSFADGVNYYLKSTKKLPIEVRLLQVPLEPWDPINSLYVAYMMTFASTYYDFDLIVYKAMNSLGKLYGQKQLLEILPLTPYLQVPVIPGYGQSWPLNNSNQQNLTAESRMNAFLNSLPQLTSNTSNDQVYKAINETLSRFKKIKGFLAFIKNSYRLGSNNWAISGNKSATGKPMLASDMHLPLTLPPIWYEMHQSSEESNLDVIGFTLVGSPYVASGHNREVAWGMTFSVADVIDWYYVVNTSTMYYYNGSWMEFTIRNETIYVKNDNPIHITIRETVLGPIISAEGYSLIARWIGREINHVIEAIRILNRMDANLETWKKAVSLFTSPHVNMAYADIKGNIGMVVAGILPIRNETAGYLGRIPRNASAGENPWLGFRTRFEEFPHVINPSSGYVMSANQQSVGSSWPYHIASFQADGYRARRIHALLETHDNITMSQMMEFQTDNYLTLADSLVPLILKHVNPDQLPSNEEKELYQKLQDWNRRMEDNSTVASFFSIFLEKIVEETFKDEWNAAQLDIRYPQHVTLEYLALTNESSIWFDDVRTPAVHETLKDIINRSWQRSINELLSRFGTIKVSYGELHQITVPHITEAEELRPFWSNTYKTSGHKFTINALDPPSFGPSERVIYDLKDWKNSRVVLPGGNSGNPYSDHYMDQLDAYMNEEYFALHSTEKTLLFTFLPF